MLIHHQTLNKKEEELVTHQNEIKNQKKNLEITTKQLEKNLSELEQKITPQPTAFTTNPEQSAEGESLFKPSNPQKFLSFDKLIGFKKELEAASGFMDYLKNKDNYQGIGEVEPPLGILMYGVPGTGKTTLVRALAKETNLPFFEVSSSLFSQKFKGLAP
ncbi:hypothetical protein PAWBP_6030 [Paulownia witches'-broom phytoplasma]|nr:hypothetical protein PAWBP_6030 [Paulownia witches'-broom phytoplasma]